MIFFDGTYRLPGHRGSQIKSDEKWAYCWRVRIINFSISQPDVRHIRPFAVVATPTGEGIFKTTCADSLGKRICRDFDLDINKTLWIEHFPDDPRHMYVATFKPKSYFGYEVFYFINWRPIRSNELEAIKPFIPEAKHITSQNYNSLMFKKP